MSEAQEPRAMIADELEFRGYQATAPLRAATLLTDWPGGFRSALAQRDGEALRLEAAAADARCVLHVGRAR